MEDQSVQEHVPADPPMATDEDAVRPSLYVRALGGLPPSLLLRLGIMMFLQYAIWGAWAPVLTTHMDELGFSPEAEGTVYSLLYLACIITPFIGGQFADRWFPVQYVIGILHVAGAVFMYFASKATGFEGLWPLMLGAGLVYAPTLALTNSVAFHHLTDNEKQFGAVRVFGTIGWIAAGTFLSAWRFGKLDAIGLGTWLNQGDCLLLGAVCAGLLGIFAFFLPRTPPSEKATSPWAFLQALKMLKNPSFLAFMMIAFVVATELQFYYILSAPFLASLNISEAAIPITKTLAQWAEIVVMAIALPLLLPRLGVRKTIAIGVIAWPIRYIIFAIGDPTWLVVSSLSLHGVCYVFFFTVSQVHVDNVASKEIRHSAQALYALITLGVGNYLGSHFTGFIRGYFTTGVGEAATTNWTGVFLVPVFLTVTCAVAFLLFFKEPPKGEKIA